MSDRKAQLRLAKITTDMAHLQQNLSAANMEPINYTDGSMHFDFESSGNKTFSVNARHSGTWTKLIVERQVPSVLTTEYDVVTGDYYQFNITGNTHTVTFDHSAGLGSQNGTMLYYFENVDGDVTPEYNVPIYIAGYTTDEEEYEQLLAMEQNIKPTYEQPELLYTAFMGEYTSVTIDASAWIKYDHTYTTGMQLENVGDYYIEFDTSNGGGGDDLTGHDQPGAIGELNSLLASYDSALATPINYNVTDGSPHIKRNGQELPTSGNVTSIDYFDTLSFNFPLLRSNATLAIHYKDTESSTQRYMMNFNVLPIDLCGSFHIYIDPEHPYPITRNIPDLPVSEITYRDGTTVSLSDILSIKRVAPIPVVNFSPDGNGIYVPSEDAADTIVTQNLEVDKYIQYIDTATHKPSEQEFTFYYDFFDTSHSIDSQFDIITAKNANDAKLLGCYSDFISKINDTHNVISNHSSPDSIFGDPWPNYSTEARGLFHNIISFDNSIHSDNGDGTYDLNIPGNIWTTVPLILNKRALNLFDLDDTEYNRAADETYMLITSDDDMTTRLSGKDEALLVEYQPDTGGLTLETFRTTFYHHRTIIPEVGLDNDLISSASELDGKSAFMSRYLIEPDANRDISGFGIYASDSNSTGFMRLIYYYKGMEFPTPFCRIKTYDAGHGNTYVNNKVPLNGVYPLLTVTDPEQTPIQLATTLKNNLTLSGLYSDNVGEYFDVPPMGSFRYSFMSGLDLRPPAYAFNIEIPTFKGYFDRNNRTDLFDSNTIRGEQYFEDGEIKTRPTQFDFISDYRDVFTAKMASDPSLANYEYNFNDEYDSSYYRGSTTLATHSDIKVGAIEILNEALGEIDTCMSEFVVPDPMNHYPIEYNGAGFGGNTRFDNNMIFRVNRNCCYTMGGHLLYILEDKMLDEIYFMTTIKYGIYLIRVLDAGDNTPIADIVKDIPITVAKKIKSDQRFLYYSGLLLPKNNLIVDMRSAPRNFAYVPNNGFYSFGIWEVLVPEPFVFETWNMTENIPKMNNGAYTNWNVLSALSVLALCAPNNFKGDVTIRYRTRHKPEISDDVARPTDRYNFIKRDTPYEVPEPVTVRFNGSPDFPVIEMDYDRNRDHPLCPPISVFLKYGHTIDEYLDKHISYPMALRFDMIDASTAFHKGGMTWDELFEYIDADDVDTLNTLNGLPSAELSRFVGHPTSAQRDTVYGYRTLTRTAVETNGYEDIILEAATDLGFFINDVNDVTITDGTYTIVAGDFKRATQRHKTFVQDVISNDIFTPDELTSTVDNPNLLLNSNTAYMNADEMKHYIAKLRVIDPAYIIANYGKQYMPAKLLSKTIPVNYVLDISGRDTSRFDGLPYYNVSNHTGDWGYNIHEFIAAGVITIDLALLACLLTYDEFIAEYSTTPYTSYINKGPASLTWDGYNQVELGMTLSATAANYEALNHKPVYIIEEIPRGFQIMVQGIKIPLIPMSAPNLGKFMCPVGINDISYLKIAVAHDMSGDYTIKFNTYFGALKESEFVSNLMDSHSITITVPNRFARSIRFTSNNKAKNLVNNLPDNLYDLNEYTENLDTWKANAPPIMSGLLNTEKYRDSAAELYRYGVEQWSDGYDEYNGFTNLDKVTSEERSRGKIYTLESVSFTCNEHIQDFQVGNVTVPGISQSVYPLFSWVDPSGNRRQNTGTNLLGLEVDLYQYKGIASSNNGSNIAVCTRNQTRNGNVSLGKPIEYVEGSLVYLGFRTFIGVGSFSFQSQVASNAVYRDRTSSITSRNKFNEAYHGLSRINYFLRVHTNTELGWHVYSQKGKLQYVITDRTFTLQNIRVYRTSKDLVIHNTDSNKRYKINVGTTHIVLQNKGVIKVDASPASVPLKVPTTIIDNRENDGANLIIKVPKETPLSNSRGELVTWSNYEDEDHIYYSVSKEEAASTEIGLQIPVYAPVVGRTDINGTVKFEVQASAEAYTASEIELGKVDLSTGIGAEVGASATFQAERQVGPLKMSNTVRVSASVSASAKSDIYFDYTKGMSTDTYVGAMAVAEVNRNSTSELGPVEMTSTNKAYVWVGAEAGGNSSVGWSEDDFGAEGEGSAFVGTKYGTQSSQAISGGGYSAKTSAGTSFGAHAGIKGGAVAKYDDGNLSLGVSGNIALLLGFEFDLEFTIPVGEILDHVQAAGELSIEAARFVWSNTELLISMAEKSLLDFSDWAIRGVIGAYDAINRGLITLSDAIRSGAVKVADAIARNLTTAAKAFNDGLITAGVAIRDFGVQIGTIAYKNAVLLSGLINDGVIVLADAISQGFGSATEWGAEQLVLLGQSVRKVADAIGREAENFAKHLWEEGVIGTARVIEDFGKRTGREMINAFREGAEALDPRNW